MTEHPPGMPSMVVVRPAPAGDLTVAMIRALGLVARSLPLFETRPLPWPVPDPGRFDGLVLTSANAVRHGGAGLVALLSLPVFAVGPATARAAKDAGFEVPVTGDSDAASLSKLFEGRRLLHLAGRDHHPVPVLETIVVYAADPVPVDARTLAGTVVLLHSARAARRLAELVDDPGMVAIAALGPAVAEAAGPGWAVVGISSEPRDMTLVGTAVRVARACVIDPPPSWPDNHPR